MFRVRTPSTVSHITLCRVCHVRDYFTRERSERSRLAGTHPCHSLSRLVALPRPPTTLPAAEFINDRQVHRTECRGRITEPINGETCSAPTNKTQRNYLYTELAIAWLPSRCYDPLLLIRRHRHRDKKALCFACIICFPEKPQVSQRSVQRAAIGSCGI